MTRPSDDEIIERVRRKLAGEGSRKPCDWPGCPRTTDAGERYCRCHRDNMIQSLKREGYLQNMPPIWSRTRGMEVSLTKRQRSSWDRWDQLDCPHAFDDLIRLIEGE